MANSYIQLGAKEGVAILRMINGANKWTMPFTQAFGIALDQVERNPDVNCLVITGQGKFFSYGLDLPWIGQQSSDTNEKFIHANDDLIQRVATFPMPTIAAVNGHAYGMGAILTLACDYKVMRRGRGWFCLPETKLKIKFAWPTFELIRLKLSKVQTFRDAAVFSKRYTAEEALKAEIVDEAVSEDQLLPAAIRYGREIAGDGLERSVVAAAKDKLFGAPVRAKQEHDLQTLSEEERQARIVAFTAGARQLSKM